MRSRSWKSVTLALSLLLGANQLAVPVMALSTSDVVYAITRRQFLPPGTALNVRIDKDQVFVSTYRHSSAEEKDCKIDAVLITRAILDAAPDEVARVTSYFYGKDMSSYQEVSVSAGDIKAFASGQMSKDQLLSSLVVRTNASQSGTDMVTRQLESTCATRPSDFKIVQDKPNSLCVTTNMEPWISDEEARLEALRIAINTFQAQKSADLIKVFLTDPAGVSETREFDFITERLDPIWKAIQNAVGSVTVNKRPAVVDLSLIRPAKGEQLEAREALLAQLKDMEKKGIGVAPFVKAFLSIEQSIKRDVDAKYIAEMVTRLKASMDDQMKAFATAKEKKVSKASPVEQPKAPPPPVNKVQSRWVTGESPIIEGEVLANPDQLVSGYEVRLGQGFKRPEDNPKFVLVLEQVAQILIKNNRGAEAGKYQQRAAQIRAALQRK